ncbi:MAG: ABC transporter permease [Syntrophobacteraceae bacterium]|jgi:lipooligosaccharide transport system permease protein|nr:ABC transporter permease [Syntrophobacteraceae bacterium]
MIPLGSLRISRRFLRVWRRNLLVYRRIWKVNFLPPILEPLFYLLAFGVGLGSFIETISHRGAVVPYVAFIAPALLSINMMYNAFFENTYASFVRMYYQKTFDAMLATPLSLEEVITGEIMWGATKSLIATALMLSVVGAFGLVRWPEGLLILPVAFLGGFAFGCLGMIFTGLLSSIDLFNLPIFLFITPMFLFSGTFFPVESLPPWAQSLTVVFPLTHLVTLTRGLCLGLPTGADWWSVAYLAAFSAVTFPAALLVMRRRLIK